MKVKFKKYEYHHYIKPIKFKKKEWKKRRKSVKRNRILRNIEEYMRENYLLFNNEYLEFTRYNQKHIRIPFIQSICISNKWIKKRERLKIVN
jgi:RNase P protein component